MSGRFCITALAGACASLSLACASGNPAVLPAGTADDSRGAQRPVLVDNTGLVTSVAGHWTITIDPRAHTARLSGTDRHNDAIGDLYSLDVGAFGVVPDAQSMELTYEPLLENWQLFYVVNHSFPAPAQPGNPPSASNRADLGIAARILYVQQAPASRTATSDPSSTVNKDDFEFTFPTAGETVVLNPKTYNISPALFRDEAYPPFLAYFNPAGLIPGAGLNGTTAFPSEPLVKNVFHMVTNTSDDGFIMAAGNNDIYGNYTATNHWSDTASLVGGTAPRIEWGGYGVLHQGQGAIQRIGLDFQETSEIFSLEAYVLAKYADPRGGGTSAQKRANRLPSNDPSKFAYKMPHGAIDLATLAVNSGPLPSTHLTVTPGSTVTRAISVIDYDSGAPVAPTKAPSESLDSIPHASGLTGIELAAGELGAQSTASITLNPFQPGKVDIENLTIENTLGADGGVDGGAWVCLRVADEEQNWVPGAGELQNLYLSESLQPIVDVPELVVYYPMWMIIDP